MTVDTMRRDEPTVEEIDEAIRWATMHGVRHWPWLDQLLDARLEARA